MASSRRGARRSGDRRSRSLSIRYEGKCRLREGTVKKLILFALVFLFSFERICLAGDSGPSVSLGDKLIDGGVYLGTTLLDDGKYMFGSAFSDMGDLLKLPLQVKDVTLRDAAIATVVLGTIPATIYGLDNPIRRNVKNIPDSTADDLVSVGSGITVGSLGLVYGWGLYSGNDDARHVALTGIEAVGLSSLLTEAVKAAFRRKRPRAGDGPRAFFKGRGHQSFVSSAATPPFAAAAAISEGFDNRWWVAVPAYGLALMVGIGRMGRDAHWASDILGSALLGAGTTELLFYLHRKREGPSSLIVMPMITDGRVAGVSFGFNW